MTDYCTIGPVTVKDAHLYDNNSVEIGGTESFTIITTNRQARQIMGLSDRNSEKESYGNLNLISGDGSWGVVWIDTSTTLTDNDFIGHRGWYKITSAAPTTDLGATYVHLEVTVEKLSQNERDYLLMDYTPGVGDGTTISNGYTDTSVNYILNEDFSDFDTSDVWYTAQYQDATTPLATPIGGDLELWGYRETAGTEGYVWTETRATHNGPSDALTLEWGAAVLTTPSSGYDHAYTLLTPYVRSTDGWSIADSIWFTVDASSSKYMYRVFGVNSAGTWSRLIPETTVSTPGITWKVVWSPYSTISANNKITISVDSGSGFVEKYSGHPQISVYQPHYAIFGLDAGGATQAKARYTKLAIYNYDTEEESFDNVVALPCTTPITTADFSRYSEDGLIPCYTNPTTELYFWNDYENYYKGSVKGYNSNYTDTTPQLITWTGETLDPDKFYAHNGLIKLTTSTGTTPVLFSAYASPAGWLDLQIISPGTIRLVKPLYISPERQTYQINDTKWTLQRGKQHVMVEHPDTTLTYTIKDYYDHDAATTTTPSADADITMATQFYCNVYDDADNERFQIVQVDPVTIKSDSIPSADKTGLGWYDNTESSSSKNYYSAIAEEFMKQPYQRVNLRTV